LLDAGTETETDADSSTNAPLTVLEVGGRMY
jgi:hypothetical protein